MRTKSVLDHEDRSFYRIAVAATDNGLPPKQTVRTLRVEVLDVNDNRPTFSSSSLIFKVSLLTLSYIIIRRRGLEWAFAFFFFKYRRWVPLLDLEDSGCLVHCFILFNFVGDSSAIPLLYVGYDMLRHLSLSLSVSSRPY